MLLYEKKIQAEKKVVDAFVGVFQIKYLSQLFLLLSENISQY